MVDTRMVLHAYGRLSRRFREHPVLNRQVGSVTFRTILSRVAWLALRPLVANPVRASGHLFYHTRQPYALSMAVGLQEPETLALVGRLLGPRMTFVDVGAHIGWYTVIAASLVGEGGRVYAFEPLTSNFALLARNVSVNGYDGIVRLANKALSDRSGVVVLFEGAEDSGASSIYPTSGVGKVGTEVECMTLDDFLEGQGWPSVDLMKIDVEGAEPMVLRGMREVVRRNPHLRLIIEYFPANLAAGGSDPQCLFALLQDLGFARISVVAERLTPVESPQEIENRFPRVVNHYVNLLCET